MKRKIIILSLFIVIFLGSLTYFCLFNGKKNLKPSESEKNATLPNTIIIDSIEIKVYDNINKEQNKEITKPKENMASNKTKKTTTKIENVNEEKKISNKSKDPISKVENVNTEKETNSNPISEADSKLETDIPQINNDLKEQENNESSTPKEDLTKIINKNSWYYSIHGDTIHFSSKQKCFNAGKEISEPNTIDIDYYRCLEVESKAHTIMGYYLNIFCKSGNCNKYITEEILNKYK